MDTGINIIYTEDEESTAEIQQTELFGYRVKTINTESITKGARDHLMYFMKESTICTYICVYTLDIRAPHHGYRNPHYRPTSPHYRLAISHYEDTNTRKGDSFHTIWIKESKVQKQSPRPIQNPPNTESMNTESTVGSTDFDKIFENGYASCSFESAKDI